MELGILIHGGAAPERIAQILAELEAAGVLRPYQAETLTTDLVGSQRGSAWSGRPHDVGAAVRPFGQRPRLTQVTVTRDRGRVW